MNLRTFVTGFGSFGTVTDNPSAKLAAASGRPCQVIEVAYRAVDDFLADLDVDSFDHLLMIGIASGRDRITPELYGRNTIGQSKDNRGYAPIGKIAEDAPLLIESTLWTPDVLSEVVAFDRRTKISMDAGSYLCNFISFKALQRFPTKKVGFLHVPAVEQVSLDEQAESIQRILSIIERQTG